MSAIYELDIKDSTNLARVDVSDFSEFQLNVMQAYLDHKEEIDDKIASSLQGWRITTIAKVELAIMRLCLTEAYYMDEVPYKVAINEAIEITKLYADDKAPGFVNGVLRKCVEGLDA